MRETVFSEQNKSERIIENRRRSETDILAGSGFFVCESVSCFCGSQASMYVAIGMLLLADSFVDHPVIICIIVRGGVIGGGIHSEKCYCLQSVPFMDILYLEELDL